MASDDFYIINSWMIEDLGLSGVELQCFAIIWSLSRGKKQMYIAGNSHLVKMTKKTKQTIITTLKRLCKKGYIKKVPTKVNNIEYNYYKAIKEGSEKFSEEEEKEYSEGSNNYTEGSNNYTGTGQKIIPPNKESNKESNNKDKKLSNDNLKEDLDFDSFYKLYPEKKSRVTAERAWAKLSVKDKKEAIKKLPAYIADCYTQKRKFQYPATYLNKKTWEDDFSDSNVEEVNEEIPEERLEGWHRSQKWMNKAIPRIAGKIGFKDFDTMRGTVYHNRDVFSEILHEINNSDYEGDIVAEFCRLAQTERYNQKIFGV